MMVIENNILDLFEDILDLLDDYSMLDKINRNEYVYNEFVDKLYKILEEYEEIPK